MTVAIQEKIAELLQAYLGAGEHGQEHELHRQFALFIYQQCVAAKFTNAQSEQVALLAMLASAQLSKGHVCLELLNHRAPGYLSLMQWQGLLDGLDEWPELTQSVPLLIENQRLYLQRYWRYECKLAKAIERKCQQTQALNLDDNFLTQLFHSQEQPDWQKLSALVAASHGFSIISGGPGTGKTTTVVKLLLLLQQHFQRSHKRAAIIQLAAPTGKAAMRLSESISQSKMKLDLTEDVLAQLPEQASTLHRLLRPNAAGAFRFNQHNPLHLDVLVVDEASMIDLPMMSKLMDAMPDHGQIIFLGDKDQLASVEAGSVLADICDNENAHGFSPAQGQRLTELSGQNYPNEFIEEQGAAIRDHICQLRKSYRFDEKSGIGQLAKAANAGDFKLWQDCLNNQLLDLNFYELSQQQFDRFIQMAVQQYSGYLQLATDADGLDSQQALAVHESFNDFQILCALREGDLGVTGLNHTIEAALLAKKLIHLPTARTWYVGRPVMIMENDYGLNLYNGDIGIALRHESGQLRVAFVSEGDIRWIKPARLPSHQTVYAMTVHKSQGSEFNHCALVLPEHNAAVLTKELIYTGITRAKQTLSCLSVSAVVEKALAQRVQRASGLQPRLWQVNHAAHTPRTDGANGAASPDDGQAQFSLF